jgi:hypothetical protein
MKHFNCRGVKISDERFKNVLYRPISSPGQSCFYCKSTLEHCTEINLRGSKADPILQGHRSLVFQYARHRRLKHVIMGI